MEKLNAAKELGVKALVISRPTLEQGISVASLINVLGLTPVKRRFPMFVELNHVLVVGGGNVAARRIATLLEFTPLITCVSEMFCEKILDLSDSINLVNKPFEISDLEGYNTVIAATDNRELNHSIYEALKGTGVHYSIADSRDECEFFFPAVAVSSILTIGITSYTGGDHSAVSDFAKKVRMLLTKEESYE
jgi:siroheme synthase-like protein